MSPRVQLFTITDVPHDASLRYARATVAEFLIEL